MKTLITPVSYYPNHLAFELEANGWQLIVYPSVKGDWKMENGSHYSNRLDRAIYNMRADTPEEMLQIAEQFAHTH